MTQNITDKVLARIYGYGRGRVFTPADFADLGPARTVQKSLQVLRNRGRIRRLATGLYDYPRRHPKLGTLAPSPDQIAEALARRDGARIQPTGAYAANLLGLSEQVPARVEFLTDAGSRRVRVGWQQIILKRTTTRNMATAGRISGLVIQALRYMGKTHVDDRVIGILDRQLSDGDRRQLVKDARYAPAWIATIMRRLGSASKVRT